MQLRAPLLVCLAAGLGACKMVNPAFGLGEESTSDAGEGDATDTVSTASSSATDTAPTDTNATDTSPTDTDPTDTDPTDTDPTDTSPTATMTDSTGETGDVNMCDLGFTDALEFRIVDEGTNTPCPETYESDGVVEGVSLANGIELIACTDACMTCTNLIELQFDPIDLLPVAQGADAECIHFKFELLVEPGSTVCKYKRAVISYYEDTQVETPLAIGSSDGMLNSPFAANFLASGGVSDWQLAEDEICDCVSPEPCCMPDDPPTVFSVQPDGHEPISVGEGVEFSAAGVAYNLQLWQAQQLDSCGAPLELSWLAVPSG